MNRPTFLILAVACIASLGFTQPADATVVPSPNPVSTPGARTILLTWTDNVRPNSVVEECFFPGGDCASLGTQYTGAGGPGSAVVPLAFPRSNKPDECTLLTPCDVVFRVDGVTSANVRITSFSDLTSYTPPVSVDDQLMVAGQLGATASVNVLDNDTAAMCQPTACVAPLSVTFASISAVPSYGSVTCTPSGACTYTVTQVPADSSATDQIYYSTTDYRGNSTHAFVTVSFSGSVPADVPEAPLVPMLPGMAAIAIVAVRRRRGCSSATPKAA